MTNKFDIDLTDEEQERYNHLKHLSILHYPKLTTDNTAANMAEYLYIYFAKNGCLPDPQEGEPTQEEIQMLKQPKIIEYKTPVDAGNTLVRHNDEEAN